HALQALGGQLVALSAAQLARLDLPEALHEAVVAAQRMHAHGARTRPMPSIGTLTRQRESTTLRRVRAALAPGCAGRQGLSRRSSSGAMARLPLAAVRTRGCAALRPTPTAQATRDLPVQPLPSACGMGTTDLQDGPRIGISWERE